MNETAFQRIVSALESAGQKVVHTSGREERAMSTCPAHDDHNPSLSIKQSGDRALLWCFAECGADAVLDALRLTKADLYDTRSATYRYADGRTVHRRYEGHRKRFVQSGATSTSTLYHLAKLREVPHDRTVFLVEGEADVHAIEAEGGVATTAPQGGGSFHKADVTPLKGRQVVCVVDRDAAGDRWAAQVGKKLDGVAGGYRFVQAAAGKDASDHIAAGHDLDDFAPYEAPEQHVSAQEFDKGSKKSASTLLVEIVTDLYEFGVSEDGDAYALARTGSRVVSMLRGGSLRAELSNAYLERTGRVPPQQALTEALLAVEGMAQREVPQRLYLRVAETADALWLDLGDLSGRAVRITVDGWTVVDVAPALFRRTKLNGPLVEPVPGGSLDDLWALLNVTEADQPLITAWLVAALYPDIPHPILGLFGEQGTGKSSAAKMLTQVLDPGPVPIRKPPRDADSWVTAAAGSWVVALDNLSDIPAWLSDSLCRAVTGDGDVRRKLYTDGDYAVFAFRRAIVLNGIDPGAMRNDLAERMLTADLDLIPEERRRTETDLWPAWKAAHPRVLGALLDLAVRVMRALPAVRLDSKPRMADFARIVAAVDQVTGTEGLARYRRRAIDLAADGLSADPFVGAMTDRLPGEGFEGTATDLLDRVTPHEYRGKNKWHAPKGWPGDSRKATTHLKRVAPAMRKTGWTVVDLGADNHLKIKRWKIIPPTWT